MLYKQDWGAAAERMNAWWAGEAIDRPIIQVTAPRDGVFERTAWDFWYLVHHPDDPDGAVAEFEKITGVPVLINTSFNVRGEPIVCTPENAYRCFANTGIDVLVMDRFVVRKDSMGG